MTAASSRGVTAGEANPFLVPIVKRWQEQPDVLFGYFYDGDDWVAVDQGGFRHRTLQFAALLNRQGIRRGEVVLLVMRHGIDAHAVFIAAMLCGLIPSFLPHPNAKQDSTLYWRQHREVFAHIQPAAIVVDADFRDAVVEAVSSSVAVLCRSGADQQVPNDLQRLPEGNAVALLQHSSGTTGLKKGVQLSYHSICMQLQAYVQALGMDAVKAPRIVSWLPLYHDMGLISSFLLPIWRGIPIVSMDPFEWTARPALFFQAIQDYAGTHAWLPNFAFLHQVRTARPSPAWKLDSLQALISCSEPCKPAAFDAFETRFAEAGVRRGMLTTCYAMAETVFAISQSPPGQPVRRLDIDRACVSTLGSVTPPTSEDRKLTLLSNGQPLDGCQVRVLRDGDFVSEREVGEICVSAPYLFAGYYKNPAASDAAFHGAWFRTGDLGFLDRGEVFVVGRLKDVIIVNGKNLFAHDVEAAVSRVAGVRPGRVVALGVYSERVGSEELVVVAERDGALADDSEVAVRINHAVLDETGVPCAEVRMVELGWLVKTTSGKTSRSENLQKYLEMR